MKTDNYIYLGVAVASVGAALFLPAAIYIGIGAIGLAALNVFNDTRFAKFEGQIRQRLSEVLLKQGELQDYKNEFIKGTNTRLKQLEDGIIDVKAVQVLRKNSINALLIKSNQHGEFITGAYKLLNSDNYEEVQSELTQIHAVD